MKHCDYALYVHSYQFYKVNYASKQSNVFGIKSHDTQLCDSLFMRIYFILSLKLCVYIECKKYA